MVHFVGAGPGAPDLITRRGAALLQKADCIIYAGSLVNPALLGLAKADCAIYNSAEMTLEQVLDVMRQMEAAGKITVRLHTGDPCLYGAIREQMDVLDAEGIPYDDTPGVSSFCGAAAALNAEYTLPTVSQTVIITRMEGRTPVPEKEKLASLAAHGATMVIFLSIGLVDKVQQALLEGKADIAWFGYKLEERGLVAIPMCYNVSFLVASAKYLKSHAEIKKVGDLINHPIIMRDTANESFSQILQCEFCNYEIGPEHKILYGDSDACKKLLIEGKGVAIDMNPNFIAEELLSSLSFPDGIGNLGLFIYAAENPLQRIR